MKFASLFLLLFINDNNEFYFKKFKKYINNNNAIFIIGIVSKFIDFIFFPIYNKFIQINCLVCTANMHIETKTSEFVNKNYVLYFFSASYLNLKGY